MRRRVRGFQLRPLVMQLGYIGIGNRRAVGGGLNVRQRLAALFAGSNFYAPRTSSITQTRGSGTPTIVRATTATVTNNDGYLVTALSGELRQQGARRVMNLVSASENLNGVSWGLLGTCTRAGGITDPLGGTTAWQLDMPANTDGIRDTSVALPAGAAVYSLWLKADTPGTISVQSLSESQVSATIFNVTTVWTRFSTTVKPNAVADTQYFIRRNGTTLTKVYVAFVQAENVTAQTTQTAGEYVSVGVLSAPYHGAGVDGVKYFNTDISGNSIPAATLDGSVVEAAATNLCLQSNAFTTTWTALGTPAATQNVVGPDGATSAWTLTDNDAGTSEGVSQTAITLTAATYTASVFVKKTTGAQASYPVFTAYLSAGTTSMAMCTIDTSNGIATAWTAYTGFTGVACTATCISFDDNYWRVAIAFTGTAVSWLVQLYPAGTTNATQSTGTLDVATQGSAVFYGAQVELGSYATAYQATTTAAATRDKDILDDQVASNLTAAAGSVAFQWTPSHAPSGTVALCGSYVDADNYTALLHDGTKYIFRKRIAATNYDAELTAAFVSGTTYDIALRWGASGSQIAVDGVLGTANTTGIEGVQYGKLTGVAGTYFSTPDSVAASITGDIDIRVKCALTDWTPAAVNCLVAKWAGAGSQLSYIFNVDTTGKLQFASSVDGSAVTNNHLSTAATTFTDGGVGFVRVTYVASTGKINFYTSSDGTTWGTLGTEVSGTTSAIFDGTSTVQIGANQSALQPTAGKIYRAQIYNTIGGTTPVVDFNPADYTHGTTWTSSATGEVYTMNGNAAVWPAVKLSTRWQWGADGNSAQQAGAAFKDKYMWATSLTDTQLRATTS